MKAPPNFGAVYGRRFDAIYPELARKHGAVLVPFVLEGVAGIPALNQADGVHPTEEGQRKMADLVWAAIEAAAGLTRGDCPRRSQRPRLDRRRRMG